MQNCVLQTWDLRDAVSRLQNHESGLSPCSYADLLKECGHASALEQGRLVHAHVSRFTDDRDTFLGNHLVHMYGKCGSVEEGRRCFHRIQHKNVFSFNIMIAAFAENGQLREAEDLFENAPEKNIVTWNAMLTAYAHQGCVQKAQATFDAMPQRNVVSWSALVAAYAQNGHPGRALMTFKRMDLEGFKPNRITFQSVLDACAGSRALVDGRILHCCIEEDRELCSEVKLQNSLVYMYGSCAEITQAEIVFGRMVHRNTVSWNSMIAAYARCGKVQEAKLTFDRTPRKDIVSWNSMISAYVQGMNSKDALEVFRAMDVKPNVWTYISVVDAVASLEDLLQGKAIHAEIVKGGFDAEVKVSNALMNMYGKCGCLEEAKAIFDRTKHPDEISWTTMIATCSQLGYGKEALQLFRNMDLEGVKLCDEFTFVSALDACCLCSALEQGKAVHARAIAEGFSWNTPLGNALLTLCAKCGTLEDAKDAFERMETRDLVSMNAMLSAFATNGRAQESVEFVRDMSLEGIAPDAITFSSVLSTCSHAGSFELAWSYFPCILGDYGIAPTMSHFTIMLDVLSRAKMAKHASDLIQNMPFEPTEVAWTSLMACASRRDELTQRSAQQMIHLDPENAAPYVLLLSTLS